MRKSVIVMGILLLGMALVMSTCSKGFFGSMDDLQDEADNSSYNFDGGDGSKDKPFQINTAVQLAKLAELVNAGNADYNAAHYQLTADINLNVEPYNQGNGWTPIGNVPNAFEGNFNGNNRKITGLFIVNPTMFKYDIGLFGYITSGKIENLGVEDVNITSAEGAGGIAGYIKGVTTVAINNCYTTGKINGVYSVGGIAGIMENAVISNCYSLCDVSGIEFRIGGIAGRISKGAGRSAIINCYSIGALEGWSGTGGIAGVLICVSDERLFDWPTGYFDPIPSIENCVALNKSITGNKNPDSFGRIVGDNFYNECTLNNNIAWSGMEVTKPRNFIRKGDGNDKVDGVDISSAAINEDGSFGGRFTSSGGWTVQNGKLPGLFGRTVELPAYLYLSDDYESSEQFSGGDGSQGNPFQINTAEQLAKLAELVNAGNTNYNTAHYILTDDIYLNVAPYNQDKGWVPIGDYQHTFMGFFNGNNKKIVGLFIDNSSPYKYDMGLFGFITAGKIENLGVEDVSITSSEGIGGIAGIIMGTTTVTIKNCYTTGKISGECIIGGITGTAENTVISNCYSLCDVNGTDKQIGGIAGIISKSSSILNCYSVGIVTGIESQSGIHETGGIAGFMELEIKAPPEGSGLISGIQNCAALNKSLTGTTTFLHRIVGNNDYDECTLNNNIAWDRMEINNPEYVERKGDGRGYLDGVDISAETINADASLGGRFTAIGGWTIQNGKLPGLSGKAVDMPAHLIVTGGTP